MKFRKNISPEIQELLKEQLNKYEEVAPMTKSERKKLHQWVASGHSPYDNGDYLYFENGCPMDFISALRFWNEFEDDKEETLPF